MRACARADDDAVVLRQHLESLAHQLTELEDLRRRVLEAEQEQRSRQKQKPSHVRLGASSQSMSRR